MALDGDFESPGGLIRLGSECLLQEERSEEAKSGLGTLAQFSEAKGAIKSSADLLRSYYAYALRDPRQCLSYVSTINFEEPLTTSQSIPSSAPTSAVGSLGSSSGLTTLETALSRTGTIASSIGAASGITKRLEGEVGDGKVWSVIERLRGRCLQGQNTNTGNAAPILTQDYRNGI